jgi:hypothetical protein
MVFNYSNICPSCQEVMGTHGRSGTILATCAGAVFKDNHVPLTACEKESNTKKVAIKESNDFFMIRGI